MESILFARCCGESGVGLPEGGKVPLVEPGEQFLRRRELRHLGDMHRGGLGLGTP